MLNYPRASPTTRALLTIGSTAFSENSTVGGGVDNVRIYNRALSAAEIKKAVVRRCILALVEYISTLQQATRRSR